MVAPDMVMPMVATMAMMLELVVRAVMQRTLSFGNRMAVWSFRPMGRRALSQGCTAESKC